MTNRHRYALLASCAIASLAAGLTLQPRDAQAVICDSTANPVGAAGNDGGSFFNVACGFNATATGPLSPVPSPGANTAIGAFSTADRGGFNVAVGYTAKANGDPVQPGFGG